MRIFSFIAFLILLVACTSKKKEVINLSDRIPKSERDYSVDSVDSVVDDQVMRELFQGEEWSYLNWHAFENNQFLDRFGADRTDKYVIYTSLSDSLTFSQWTFKDSLKTKSAFFNWMDTEEIDYFGAPKAIQKEPLWMYYGDTSILLLSGSIQFKDWRKLFEEQKRLNEGDYIIEQRKYGRARWYQWRKDKLEELKED